MLTDLSSVRDGYDRWAEFYDGEANPLAALEQPVVAGAIGEVGGRRVLDLGCGTGRHATWMAAAGAEVTGVDFSEGMLERARAKAGAERIRFLVHDLRTPLPFGAEFDLVVSGLVLEHLPDFDQFLREARRVLKSPGRAILSTLHPAMFLLGTQARFTDPRTGELVQPGSRRYGVGTIVMAALRAGFRLGDVIEAAPSAEFASRYPRAEKYIDWPMLLVLVLQT